MPGTTLASVDFGSTVTDGIAKVTTFVPKLVGFLVILLVGYFIAKVVAKVLDKVLERLHFDEAVERGPVKRALSRSRYDASDIVSRLAFYAIFIPFLSAAVGTLGIVALQQPLTAFIALIPKIIVAVVLVVLGGVVAGAVKKLLENTLGGLSYGTILGDAVGVLVILGFLKAALDEVGVATNVTGPLLYAILGTVAGILIVGVGGALIKPMQGRLETALTTASAEASTAQQSVQAGSGRSTTPTGAGQPVSSRSDGQPHRTTGTTGTTGSSTRI